MKDIVQFITAGNALFTLENTATGNRFTFRVRQVIRVIPDKSKDIGFQVLYLLHYKIPPPLVVCGSMVEACEVLESLERDVPQMETSALEACWSASSGRAANR